MSSLAEPVTTQAHTPPVTPRPVDQWVRGLLGLSLILALASVFFICMLPIAITDFWWQLRTGEIILRTGRIPYHDPFSWTAAGQPWMVHEWLTEVLFYLLYEHLPSWVLLGFKCGLAVVSCYIVYLRGRFRSGSAFFGIGAALAAGCVMQNFADLRPQMISFVMIAGLLLALDKYQERQWQLLPWLLPLAFALWVNFHGGVVVGLILLAIWVIGQGIGYLIWRDPAPGLWRLALALIASCLAVALNPNGFHVYTYPFQVLGHPEVMDYISEWFSPNFHAPKMRPFELVALGTMAGLALARGHRSERRLGEVLLLVATLHAALVSQRNTVLFALVAAPVMVAAFAALWNEAAAFAWLDRLQRLPALRLAGSFGLAVAMGALVYNQVPPKAPGQWFDYATRMHEFPQGAVPLLKEGMWPGKLYNDYSWGGYLIWKLYPERPVFIDGRAEVYYPTKAFDDEMKIHTAAEGWLGVLDRRQVDVILTNKVGFLSYALKSTPGWKLAFTGNSEVVYVRTKPKEKEKSGA